MMMMIMVRTASTQLDDHGSRKLSSCISRATSMLTYFALEHVPFKGLVCRANSVIYHTLGLHNLVFAIQT